MPLSKESIYNKYFYPVSFAAFGAGGVAITNFVNKKPIHAGIQKHILFGLIGLAIGYYGDQYLERKWAKRDAIIRHYIELHPEDFVENRKKYKEIFDAWPPVR